MYKMYNISKQDAHCDVYYVDQISGASIAPNLWSNGEQCSLLAIRLIVFSALH